MLSLLIFYLIATGEIVYISGASTADPVETEWAEWRENVLPFGYTTDDTWCMVVCDEATIVRVMQEIVGIDVDPGTWAEDREKDKIVFLGPRVLEPLPEKEVLKDKMMADLLALKIKGVSKMTPEEKDAALDLVLAVLVDGSVT